MTDDTKIVPLLRPAPEGPWSPRQALLDALNDLENGAIAPTAIFIAGVHRAADADYAGRPAFYYAAGEEIEVVGAALVALDRYRAS